MSRLLLLSLAVAAVPISAAALDVRPDPVSAAASPLGGAVIALVALVAGFWYMRRRRGR